MKKLVLTIALVLTACGTEGAAGPTGPTGPTGPSGPPGSYTKGDIYCLGALPAVSDTSDGTSWSIAAACLDANDLPLTGSCANGATGLPAGVWLSVDEPRNWSVTDQPASWFCQWQTATPLTSPSLVGTRAEICCITQ